MRTNPRSPAGGRQDLSKKMPADTRYVGDSYPADRKYLRERYDEHMAKQRAAQAQPSRRPSK